MAGFWSLKVAKLYKYLLTRMSGPVGPLILVSYTFDQVQYMSQEDFLRHHLLRQTF